MTELEKATSVYVDKKRLKFWNDVRKSGCLVFPECVFNDKDLEEAFIAGANWQYEQFEKNRLAACDNMTKEEADRGQEFTTDFIEKNNRVPTYSDAIEYGRESMRERLTKLEELADRMYYAAQYLTTDASKLRKAMRDYWHYVVYELKEDRQ